MNKSRATLQQRLAQADANRNRAREADFREFNEQGKALNIAAGSGGSAPFSQLFSFLPGSGFDYKNEAGNLWENSLVLLCLKWQERVFPEARLCIERLDGGQWAKDYSHPLLELFAHPNDDDTFTELFLATLLWLSLDGNAYLYKLRAVTDKVVGFQYLPANQTAPDGPDDGSQLITQYLYRANNKVYKLPKKDVIHFRDGKDPLNPRLGLSALSALSREVCTDNEALTYKAALMRNMGVCPVMFTPRSEGEELTKEKADRLERRYMEKTTGDRRGEPMFFNVPLDRHEMAVSPDKLSVELMHEVPEERIPASLGIQPVVVGVGAGLENSNNRASFEAALRQSWDQGLIPRQRILAERLTLNLLSEKQFGHGKQAGVSVRVGWDYSGVAALQEDQNAKHERERDDFEACLTSRDEARKAIGHEEIDGGKKVFYCDLMPLKAKNAPPENEPATPAPAADAN